MLVQTKLNQIIDKLGISEQEFQMTTMYYGQDQRKAMQLMQLQQQTAGAAAESHAVLTRAKTIETFKVQQDLQMNSMDEMLRDGMGQEPNS